MKVVVDTNVFVSGIFWKGPPSKVLSAWQKGQFKLVVSPPILEEYRRILNDLSHVHPNPILGPIMDLVSLNAEMVNPVRFVKAVCADHDDDKFLEAAIVARANYVVSGDKALLAVKSIKGSTIIKPSGFWRRSNE